MCDLFTINKASEGLLVCFQLYVRFIRRCGYCYIVWSESSSFLSSQQQELCPDQLLVITILSLLVLWEMNLHVSIPTGSPDAANKLKSIGLSLVFIALGSL